MNVSVKVMEPDSSQVRKKILVVNKDFAPGEVIYKVYSPITVLAHPTLNQVQENPVVTVLDPDLQDKGSHCSHCLRQIQKGMAIGPSSDSLESVYCSKDCQVKSKIQSQNLLFSLDPPLPTELAPLMPPQGLEARKNAQMAFVAYIKRISKAAPLLVAKFIARQVAFETANMIPLGSSLFGSDLPEADGGQYTLYDHIERLRYLDVPAPEQEVKLLSNVLKTALPGLEQFITDERHAMLLGKMGYNMYGICFDSGRDDKVGFQPWSRRKKEISIIPFQPPSTERPEDEEKTRTPHGTSRQIGSGFFTVSSYVSPLRSSWRPSTLKTPFPDLALMRTDR